MRGSTEHLVSVWMITYNHEKYIRQALESVFMQKTDFYFDVVIGEDASTDNTRKIIDEFKQKYGDRLITVYHDKNVGYIRNAFEFCAPLLKGKYVAILEGDDYWTDPLKLQKQVDFLRLNDLYVIVGCHRIVVNENGETLKYQRLKMLRSQCVLFKNLFNSFPKIFFKYILRVSNGDTFLFLTLSQFGKSKILDFYGASYRLHKNGVYSVKDDIYKAVHGVRTPRLYLKFLSEIGKSDKKLKIRYNLSLIYAVNKLCQAKKKYYARKYFLSFKENTFKVPFIYYLFKFNYSLRILNQIRLFLINNYRSSCKLP